MASQTMEITMRKSPNNQVAPDAFIARKAEIDRMLERLTHCVAIISTSAPARSTGAMPGHPPTTPSF
jgi:hypothetical protein